VVRPSSRTAEPGRRHTSGTSSLIARDNEARDAGEAWGTAEPEQRECDWEA